MVVGETLVVIVFVSHTAGGAALRARLGGDKVEEEWEEEKCFQSSPD